MAPEAWLPGGLFNPAGCRGDYSTLPADGTLFNPAWLGGHYSTLPG